jgi:hypothetical protein
LRRLGCSRKKSDSFHALRWNIIGFIDRNRSSLATHLLAAQNEKMPAQAGEESASGDDTDPLHHHLWCETPLLIAAAVALPGKQSRSVVSRSVLDVDATRRHISVLCGTIDNAPLLMDRRRGTRLEAKGVAAVTEALAVVLD